MHKHEKMFIGRGAGTGALRVYRKVVIDSVQCFEKIYHNESIGLIKTEWFYSSILPLLETSTIQAPKILYIAKGEKVSALYFEYIDIIHPTQAQAFERATSLYKIFYNINTNTYTPPSKLFYKFHISYFYSSGVAGILKIFKNDKSKFEAFRLMEETVKECRHCFCHGDLSISNMILPTYTIDFDECGIYPFGFDIARVLVRFLKHLSFNEIEQYLESAFSEIAAGVEWNTFLFSVCFFSFVFSSKNSNYNNLQKELFEILIVLHKKILNTETADAPYSSPDFPEN